jgi:hypothetical protein
VSYIRAAYDYKLRRSEAEESAQRDEQPQQAPAAQDVPAAQRS